MARVDLNTITRDQVLEIVERGKGLGKDKNPRDRRDHVRQELSLAHPELESTTIVRNGKTYNAMDYLLGDVESYGSFES